MRSDLHYALRRLRQTPLFSTFAVVTLALGIGAATAVYSVVYAVALKAPSIADVERVVKVYHSDGGSTAMSGFSWPDIIDLKARQTSFSHLATWTRLTHAITLPEGSRPFRGEFVDGDYFDVLRVRPMAGRLIQRADDTRTGFLAFGDDTDRERRWVSAVGRLRDGVRLDQAAAEVRQIGASLDAAVPIGRDADQRSRSPYAISRPWVVKRLVDVRMHESIQDCRTCRRDGPDLGGARVDGGVHEPRQPAACPRRQPTTRVRGENGAGSFSLAAPA